MVISNIFAGLGNQMFQYANARRLAHRLGVELKLDLSSFDRCQFRKFQLDRFALSSRAASPAEVEAICGPEPRTVIFRAARKARQLVNERFNHRWGGLVKEKHFHFDPAMLALPDRVYLFGLWQTERYFADCADVIRADFQVQEPPTDRNAELLAAIHEAEDAVSLHVRRGDYVSDPHSQQSHGVCGLDYYDRAIAHLSRSVAAPRFFVFSDDIAWARENLRLPSPANFIDHNGSEHAVEDIRLMGRCRHHIIANSSFSWWGAWLNPRPEKIVCAPRRWFNKDALKQRNTADVLPSSWVAL